MLNDKRVRQLLIAVLVVILALGLLSLVSTVFQMIVPLAIVIAGAFAFYKIALEGRDKSAIATDDDSQSEADVDAEADEATERLSATDKARGDFLDAATPAEEILDQIKSRRRRLQGDDEP